MFLTSAVSTLADGIRGEVIAADHPDFDQICALDNACRQTWPALVVRCTTDTDVVEAIRFATSAGLPVAVRAGGHSAAGFGSVEAGLVIDLRPIDHVRVDPETRIAAIGGGALAGAVDRATHEYGLATTTPTVSTVGMAGFTLGGGISYLTRKHGLAVDNLVGADVVLADGTRVRAGQDGDPELLWALAGGGGNVGVVTELRMRLHPVSIVTGGPMLFPIEDCERIVRLFRDWITDQPDDIYAFLALLSVPPADPFPEQLWLRPVCALVCCNTAPEPAAERSLAVFRDSAPLLDLVGRIPYPALQSAFDAGARAGSYGHLSGLLYRDLPDAATRVFEPWGAVPPTPLCQSHLYPLDGAAARADTCGTAWPWREAAFAQMFAGLAPEPGRESDLRVWSTGFRDALQDYALPGCYANFLMDEGPEAARACYGANADRLAELKGRYDPGNLFRRNQNVPPMRRARR
jgi:hypothetical protein